MPPFCRFLMTQSRNISTDAMFAIVNDGNLRPDSHCPLEEVLRNSHNTETGRRYEGPYESGEQLGRLV